NHSPDPSKPRPPAGFFFSPQRKTAAEGRSCGQGRRFIISLVLLARVEILDRLESIDAKIGTSEKTSLHPAI
ncbi:MAG TPA: hypothetical protein DEF12_09705, partial [Rhodobacteraceae bacterium]|nr:hypothetical protein [Paracoccaceae bacterium]